MGFYGQATKAKEETIIGQEKEQVEIAYVSAAINKLGDDVTDQDLQNELDKSVGFTKTLVTTNGDGTLNVLFNDTEHNYNVNNGTVSKVELPAKKTLADLKTEGIVVTSNTTISDENGDNITIPSGFNVESNSPTKIVEGVVIEDSQDNQYVWIPVFEKSASREWGIDYSAVATKKTAENSEFTETDYTNIQSALKTYTASYANSSYSDEYYYKNYGYYDISDTTKTSLIYYTNGNMSQSEYENLYHNMLISIYKNGGFYIGRYEMGTGVATSTSEAQNLTRTSMSEYISTKTNPNNEAPTIEGMPTPISKANAVGYSCITQSQAQMLAKKVGEEYGYGTTTSSLMFGVQWDAVCVFIENYDTRNSAPTKSDWLKNSTYAIEWGNYYKSTFAMDRGFYNILTSDYKILAENWNLNDTKSSSDSWLCTTGATEQNKSLNIYDFAGNLNEYTLECNPGADNALITRGGFFYGGKLYYTNQIPVTCRNSWTTYGNSPAGSGRVALLL